MDITSQRLGPGRQPVGSSGANFDISADSGQTLPEISDKPSSEKKGNEVSCVSSCLEIATLPEALPCRHQVMEISSEVYEMIAKDEMIAEET